MSDPFHKTCFECDEVAIFDHHVVPKSRGGRRTVPLCAACHAKAHHRDGNRDTANLTSDALQAKIRRGERRGRLRFGYDLANDGKTLIPNPREQQAIARMRQWRAQGKTYRDLVWLVEDLGIDTKTGGIWRPQTIRQILTRPVA